MVLSSIGALFGLVGRIIDSASHSLAPMPSEIQPQPNPSNHASISLSPSLPLPDEDAGGNVRDVSAAIRAAKSKDPPLALPLPLASKIKINGKKKLVAAAPTLSECFYVVPAALPLSCVTAWGTDGDRKKVLVAQKDATITMKIFFSLSRLLMPLTEEVQVVMSFDCGTRSVEIGTHVITMDELISGQTEVTLCETEIDKLIHHMHMVDGPEQDKRGCIHHPAGILKLSIFHKARRLETLVEANESETQSSSSDLNAEEKDRESSEEPQNRERPAVIKRKVKLTSIAEDVQGEGGKEDVASPAVTLPYPRIERQSLYPPSASGAVYGGAVFEYKSSSGSDDSSSLAGGENMMTILNLIKGEAKGRKSLLRLLATLNVLVLPFDAAIEFQRRYEITILDTMRIKTGGVEPEEPAPQEPQVDPDLWQHPFSFLDDPSIPRPRFTILRTQHAPPRRVQSRDRVLGRSSFEDARGIGSPASSTSRSVPNVTTTDDNPIIPFDPEFDFDAFLIQEEAALAEEVEAARALPSSIGKVVFESFDPVHAEIFHRSVRSMEEDMRTLFLASSRVLFNMGFDQTDGEIEDTADEGSQTASMKEGPSASVSLEQRMKEKSACIFAPDLLSYLAHCEMWALFHLVIEWHYGSADLSLKHEGLPSPPHITSTFLAKSFCSKAGIPAPPELRAKGKEIVLKFKMGEKPTEEEMLLYWKKPPRAPRPRKPTAEFNEL